MLIIVDLEGKTRTMGEAATEVMKTAQEGDNLVNYVDVSAKHAVRDTEYNLALKGGIASTECGEFNGVPYWYVDGKCVLAGADYVGCSCCSISYSLVSFVFYFGMVIFNLDNGTCFLSDKGQ